MKFRVRPGQTLVVILLVLAVVATVGLSIVSRSVTEVGVSTTQDEAARALSAAEAGIEASLGNVVAQLNDVPAGETGATYTVQFDSGFGGGTEVAIGEGLGAGETATVWLTGHDEDTGKLISQGEYPGSQIRVCWGQNVNGAAAEAPAVETMVYYKDGAGEYLVSRGAWDPNSGRLGTNSFAPADNGGDCPAGKTYSFSKTIDLPAGELLFLRIKPLYNGENEHFVGVKSVDGARLPDQGKLITSVGKAVGNDGAVATRKVQVKAGFSDLWPQMDSAVWSGGGLTK